MKAWNSLLLLLAALLRWNAAASPAEESLSALQARMNALLDQPRFSQAQWGVKVSSLASGKTIFERNAEKLLKPASNTKMYTCALALDRLGPEFRIKTSFYAAARPDANGGVHGDLIVYGRGDPCFAARFNDGDYSKALQPALDALAAAGIKRVEGDLVGDDSYFHGPPYGSEWTWDDLQEYYGAPASALTLQENTIDLSFKPGAEIGQPCQIETMPRTTYMTFDNRTKTTTAKTPASIDLYRPLAENTTYVWGGLPLGGKTVENSVSIANPALWFVTQLKDALADRGITVMGRVRSIGWLERELAPLDRSRLTEVATVQSRPLAEIVKYTMKPSQNQYAQLLLLQAGTNTPRGRDPATRSTEDDGLAEMRRFLTEAGIKRGQVLLQEGSGLSRGALVTPAASVQLLTYVTKQRWAASFTNALPIAGVDGTLRNRFKGTAAAGNLRAKTGSLEYVDTLSGFLTTKGGDALVFSIMLNNYRSPGGHEDGRAEIDTLANMLADFGGKIP